MRAIFIKLYVSDGRFYLAGNLVVKNRKISRIRVNILRKTPVDFCNYYNGNSLILPPYSQNCPKAKFYLQMKKFKSPAKKEPPGKTKAPQKKANAKEEKRQSAKSRDEENAQPHELFWDGYSDIGYC
jgi:hypothetical protein